MDAKRLAVLQRALESLEERKDLLVGLRRDYHRAGTDVERRLRVPVPSGVEVGRRSSLRQDVRALTSAVSDGIEARLSDLDDERQDLFCRMSEEGMRDGLWVRNPLNLRTGITLQGRGTSRGLWEAPWRAARNAPPALPPREVAGCANYLKQRLLFDLKILLVCLAIALGAAGGGHALAESPPQTAMGFVFGEYVFPFVGWSASAVLLTHLLITFPTSLYGFCRPGAFMRRQADMEMPDVNPDFVRLAKERGFYSKDLMERVARHGSVGDETVFPDVPEDVRRVWVTAQDVSPEWHVRMQAAFQEHTSMGISKTINLPNEATTEEVENAYRQAYATGCKGIAVYRDGSRDAQVLSTGGTEGLPSERKEETHGALHGLGDASFLDPYLEAIEHPEDPRAQELLRDVPAPIRRDIELMARARKESPRRAVQQAPAPTLAEARNDRPNELTGVTKKLTTGHGPMYVTLNDDEFGPRECFVILGKPGGTAAAFSDALGRMISLAMTHGAPPEEVVKQLRGIQDGHPAGFGPSAVLSVPDGVARAMAEYYLSDGSAGPAQAQLPIVGSCPECSAELSHESGCEVCHSCGYSKCS